LEDDTTSAPYTPLEALIAALWQEVLHVERVRVQDNFFDLGGHSLLSVQVIDKLKTNLGVQLSPRDLVGQTLGQLAATCEERLHCSQQKEPASLRQRLLHALKRTVSPGYR